MQIVECCVCSQEANCFTVKCSCSDKELNYCPVCLTQGYENYNELVNYGFVFEAFNTSYRDKVVIPTLRYYNKTVDEFNKDVLQRGDLVG